MNRDFSDISVFARGKQALSAAALLSQEIESRTGKRPALVQTAQEASFAFICDGRDCRDSYSIACDCRGITVCAHGIRGFIYAIGMFLRKCEFAGKSITLIKDIAGEYVPDKHIRGHQLGYRTTPNTYDAWGCDEYRRYYLDIMFFGCNTAEHIPYENKVSRRNALMKYDEEELLVKAAEIADEYDLDVSLWYPNCEDESVEDAVKRRKALFERVPRINAVFPPGGDPGELYPDDFMLRCREISKVLKQAHPNAEMWPSAQQPHSIPRWGEDFIAELEQLPDEIDGIITGPNRAFPLDELRRRLPSKYPIRLYPDITHNVRCEYPVHFNRDDWHFALATGLSRECTNPRPTEYRLIHRLTRRYVEGSVSYSEGVTDDVNKMVWSDMDFFPDVSVRETLCDYSRLFFPGAPADTVADMILALELNWQCDPAENPNITHTFETAKRLSFEYPFLNGNWRFNQLLFRAECDEIIRQRRLFELELLSRAVPMLECGRLDEARGILETPFDEEYLLMRRDLERLAKLLFDEIGLQLDTKRYLTDGWERGAVLETIDLPVTDRAWLLTKLERSLELPEAERAAYMARAARRNRVDNDEYYFSVALNGLDECSAEQTGEVYMNFQGDRPNVNNGSMPTGMFKVYDNLSFRCKIGGFKPDTDYILKITFADKRIPLLKHHKITANGITIYEGEQFGGEGDEQFDSEMLAPGFVSAAYRLPKEVFVNGCVELEFSEPHMGVMFSEFRIIKA